MKNKILLIGAGPMAIDYFKVLKELGFESLVIGRGDSTADSFETETGERVIRGGLTKWLNKTSEIPTTAIVAVTENLLGKVTIELLQKGVKKILVEKPGGLDYKDIRKVEKTAIRSKANVFVGYNRRFYASVLKAKEIIEIDGGVSSFNFEFTEWGHVILDYPKAEGVWDEWFLQNSSHVVDLAFYLGGNPKKFDNYIAGTSNWHSRATVYAGSGITEKGALFTYHANWAAPGRWGVEILTSKHRLYLRPMEKLQIQRLGSVSIDFVQIDDELDTKFKPGLYRQVEDFLLNNGKKMLTISEQVKNLDYYKKIEKI